jgi:hypothetical protein
MLSYASRNRSPLALTVVLGALSALVACAGEPSAPIAPSDRASNFAAGDVITVTNTSGGTEWGSLRWAVGVTTGGETIRFDPSLAGATITLDTTLKALHFVTIEGPRDRGVTISGGGKVRVMHFADGAHLLNLSITGGLASNGAGGIHSDGRLVVENSAVWNNTGTYGAAIYAHLVAVSNSTIAGNSSAYASAIAFEDAQGLTLVNSTVARNGPGYAIGSHGLTYLTPYVFLSNSILVENGTPGTYSRNCDLATLRYVTYDGTSMLDDRSCGDTTKVRIANPMLGTMADHGGPGPTIDLPRESPAVNATTCALATDQRNVPRDAQCDVGAFEVTEFTRVTLVVNPNVAVDQRTGWAVVTGTVSCSRGEPYTLGLQVDLKQDQKSGRTSTVVQASAPTTFTCATSAQPWSVALAPSAGTFGNGAAQLAVQTSNMPEWIIPSTVSTTAKLYWGRK